MGGKYKFFSGPFFDFQPSDGVENQASNFARNDKIREIKTKQIQPMMKVTGRNKSVGYGDHSIAITCMYLFVTLFFLNIFLTRRPLSRQGRPTGI